MTRIHTRRRFNLRLPAAMLFLTAIVVIWAERSMAPILFTCGEHAATTKAQAIFAEAVGEVCADTAFSSAVALERDDGGNVQVLSGNTALQNQLQSRLAAALCEAFEQTDRTSFSVPLWSLFGDSLSAGHGPSVRFSIAMEGSPVVTIADAFTDAGFNQTYHTVTAHAEITVLVTALGRQSEQSLSLSVPVSQTVIVGDVPSVVAGFSER